VSTESSAIYTFTSPRGIVAVVNNPAIATVPPASGAFVGWLTETPAGLDAPDIREAFANVPQGDGGVHGDFHYGRRPLVFQGVIPTDPLNYENPRIDLLAAATDAMKADGTITWTESGSTIQKLVRFRLQSFRITGLRPKEFTVGVVSADYRIVSNTEHSASASSTVNNAGNTGSLPRFQLTSGTYTNPTFTNGATGETLQVMVTGSGTLIVDFVTRTITQGGVDKRSQLVWPASTWWELAPGNTAVSVSSGSGTVFWRDAFRT
jgi:hypothetical protein